MIVVPAVEDLDPAYIDPPRTTAPASGNRPRQAVVPRRRRSNRKAWYHQSSSDDDRRKPISTATTNRGLATRYRCAGRAGPTRSRPARVRRRFQRTGSGPHRSPIHRPLGDDDAITTTRTRTAARPRTTTAYSRDAPVYRSAKTKRYGPSPATCSATPTAPARSST